MSGFVIGNDDFNIRQNVSPDQGVTQFYVDQHDAATLQDAKDYVDSKGYAESDDLGELAYKDSASGSFTPAGGVTVETDATGSEKNYKPAGTVSKPDITVTPTTDTVYSITDVGTLPALSFSLANEVLTISFNAGTLPTKGSGQTVMTGAAAALDSAPVFEGTEAEISATFTGSSGEVTVS